MQIKIFRTYWGNYLADNLKLQDMRYSNLKISKPIMVIINENQGFGKIEGSTKKLGANYASVTVCAFKKETRQMLWETKSKSDGTYSFRNIALGFECFIVAFDPNNQYNAVIQDKLTPFDGRVG